MSFAPQPHPVVEIQEDGAGNAIVRTIEDRM